MRDAARQRVDWEPFEQSEAAMQGDKDIIKHLNTVLRNELTAINQYFLHARMLDNWGVTQLGAKSKQEAIEEMHHADALIQRILLLEGLPNLQNLGKLMIGQDTKETLECDLKLEQLALEDLKAGIAHAEKIGDYVSRDLLRKIMTDEEDHVDFIETQLDLIGRIGLERYEQAKI